MYSQPRQSSEEALKPELLPSYLPALNTVFSFGDLYPRTGREDMAKIMYIRALVGYTAFQRPSSEECRRLADRFQALQVSSTELSTRQAKSTDI
jgi:hypothetical protein